MGKSRGERRVIFYSSGAIQIICLCRHDLGVAYGGRRVVEILRRLLCRRLVVDEESVKGEVREGLSDAIVGLCFPPSRSETGNLTLEIQPRKPTVNNTNCLSHQLLCKHIQTTRQIMNLHFHFPRANACQPGGTFTKTYRRKQGEKFFT